MQALEPPWNEVHIAPQVARSDISALTYDQFSVLSRFSLAVLADTGWYTVAAGFAEPMQWGRGEPQSFLATDGTDSQVRHSPLATLCH